MTTRMDISGLKKTLGVSFGLSALLLATAPAAFAADDGQAATRKSNAWSTQTLTVSPQPLNLDLGKIDSAMPNQALLGSTDFNVGTDAHFGASLLDMTGDGANPLFNLDQAGQLCLSTSDDCAQNAQDRFGLGYSHDFGKKSSGLDYALVPRAGVSFDDDSQSALVGALVKIGDDLKSGTEINPNTWYFFAGADAQAMTYTPGANTTFNAGRFALRDQIIVGDAQAGLAYRLGDADLSLTYLRREARAENYKFEEDAAALSFTWRR